MKDLLKDLVIAVVIYFLLFFNLPYYLDVPGGLDNINSMIVVNNDYVFDASINSTYVNQYSNCNIIMYGLSYLIPDWDLVAVQDELGTMSSEENDKVGLLDFNSSMSSAVIAAFKLSGLDYTVNNHQIYVSYIFDEADTNLKVGDIIKNANDVVIERPSDLKELINNLDVGSELKLIVNDNEEKYALIVSYEDRKIIGITYGENYDVTTIPSVEYKDQNNVFGPSAGAMMSLYVYSAVNNFDLPDGAVISGTGTIDADGNVGSIGGVKYKLIGAYKNGADIFFVPVDNYEEACLIKEDKGYDIDVVKVSNLDDIIKYLEGYNDNR